MIEIAKVFQYQTKAIQIRTMHMLSTENSTNFVDPCEFH